MDEDSIRGAVEAGRCLAVRSDAARKWTPLAESSFAVAEERPLTVGDLGPAEFGKLMTSAIALGILKAAIALMGLSFLLGLLWQFLR